jgi:hypothetical protein
MTKELTMLRWWCLALLAACNGPDTSTDDTDEDTETPATTWECVLEAGSSPPYAEQIGCEADWDVVAANPFDGSIPGAHSGKTVIDRSDGNRLYFQNSNQYGIHWEFASANLSGQARCRSCPISARVQHHRVLQPRAAGSSWARSPTTPSPTSGCTRSPRTTRLTSR